MAGLVTRLAAKVADTWRRSRTSEKDEKPERREKEAGGAHQTVRRAPLVLLRDVRHVRKDHGEGDGKNSRHGDDGKVPPRGDDGFVKTTVNNGS